MIRRIDHLGIAVSGLEERLPFWAEALGLSVGGMETVDSEKVKVAFLPAGDSSIELLEATDDSSAIRGFLDKRGEGIHHIALEVDDIDRSLERLQEHSVTVLGGGARPGADGSRVAFLHPRSTGGVLVELVEHAPRAPESESDIVPGQAVLAYQREPQEKIWGLLRRIDAAGIVIEGIDLASFDDWVAQIERDEESVIGPSVLFVPMSRVEKILLDRSSGHLPSLSDRFERRTGRRLQEVVADLATQFRDPE